ncbi:MAG: class I SAM-dependent methyltransferase [Gemmatimonadaceae bacterium]|nr:class I SAM-dependent methyltransferase [Gemmatimonadaceae bacterium]
MHTVVATMQSVDEATLDVAVVNAGKQYWQQCRNTFLAPADYYERQAAALARVLPTYLAAGATALDLGCGNGVFTLLIARLVAHVHGVDLSPALITEAQELARRTETPNATFAVRDLETRTVPPRVDAVFCMGVLVTIPSDAVARNILVEAALALQPGGVLVLRDSVSVGGPELVQHDTGYLARYRPERQFIALVTDAGFELSESHVLLEWPGYVNRMMVFRRTADTPRGDALAG